MSELFMRAYYHTFQPTGELCADRILSAVARAGKSAHHTADWYDEWHNIQNAANATAEEVKNLRQRLAEAEAKLTETEKELFILASDVFFCGWGVNAGLLDKAKRIYEGLCESGGEE